MSEALTAVENAHVFVCEAEAWLVRAEGLSGSAYVEFMRCGQEAANRARRILVSLEKVIEEGLAVPKGAEIGT
jgi:hypothetical protein